MNIDQWKTKFAASKHSHQHIGSLYIVSIINSMVMLSIMYTHCKNCVAKLLFMQLGIQGPTDSQA